VQQQSRVAAAMSTVSSMPYNTSSKIDSCPGDSPGSATTVSCRYVLRRCQRRQNPLERSDFKNFPIHVGNWYASGVFGKSIQSAHLL